MIGVLASLVALVGLGLATNKAYAYCVRRNLPGRHPMVWLTFALMLLFLMALGAPARFL